MTINELFVKNSRPKRAFNSIALLGSKAYNLATSHQTEIDSRLPGVTARLGADITAMNVVVPGAVLARNEVVAATSAQSALVLKGYTRVAEIRETVRKSGASKEIRKAYGVGRRVSAKDQVHVQASLKQIVDRATSEPEEAAAFGLIAIDVTALADLLEALTLGDTSQDQKRVQAPLSTKERNETANRILQTVALIGGAGRSAFADDPKVHASFDELMEDLESSGTGKAKKGEKEAPAPKPKACEGSADRPVAKEGEEPPAAPMAKEGEEPPAAPERSAKAAPEGAAAISPV